MRRLSVFTLGLLLAGAIGAASAQSSSAQSNSTQPKSIQSNSIQNRSTQPSKAAPQTVVLKPVLSPAVAALLARGPRGGGAHTGLLVYDITAGKTLEAARPDELFIPASTMKLVSMGAVLSQRGAQSWLSVDVTAPAQEVAARKSRLSFITLRGNGDPSFDLDGPYSLSALAKQLAARGVREVGEVRLLPAFNEASWPYQPLLGTAVSSFRLASLPGWNASASTYQEWARAAFVRRLQAAGIKVTGAGKAAAPGTLLGQSLARETARQLGQSVPAAPGVVGETGVASVRSAPLHQLLARTLKPSDNLWAEQLATNLAQRGNNLNASAGDGWQKSATHAAMIAGQRQYLQRAGVNVAPLSLDDASGLSRANRLTPRTLLTVLRRAYDLPLTPGGVTLTPAQAYAQHKNLFIEALPVAGTGSATAATLQRGGTLSDRLKGLDVRAKTGTLPGVSSLAGFVRAKSGHLLVFSIMLDRTQVGTLELRAFQDEVVRLLAKQY